MSAAEQHARLRGRVVLMTGASRGVGAALASTLGAAGMRLVLADSAVQRVQDFAAVLAERDIDAIALPLNVDDPAQCEAAVATVARRYGRLDALINNAELHASAAAPCFAADWQRTLTVNLWAPFVLSKHASALMLRQGEGHIVNITSGAAGACEPSASAYQVTEWGLLGVTRALHDELRSQGIHVTAVVARRGAMVRPPKPGPTVDLGTRPDPLHIAHAVRDLLQNAMPRRREVTSAMPTAEPSLN